MISTLLRPRGSSCRRLTLTFGLALVGLLATLSSCSDPAPVDTDWPVYLGDAHSSQFSELRQINRQNVGSLKVAWTYSTGDASPQNRSQIQANPLIIDGVLYGSSASARFFAVDAVTGAPVWTFDPFSQDRKRAGNGVNRGVAWWSDGGQSRILAATGPWIFSINAQTGELDPAFGDGGAADMRRGLETGDLTSDQVYVESRTPGIVFENLLIMGSVVSEGYGAAPGHVRAYDVRTGAVAWTFYTIPRPGQFGSDTWPPGAAEKAGGANSWPGLSLDEERAVVYVPTGSSTPDFFGGNRKGANLFANCILALNARTGERIWHFQTVHHDLWDRDLPAPPNLVTVEQDGRQVDAVAQITKSGFVFLLDRDTGVPLFPVEERPVPASDVPGEEAFPTQPIPTLPPPFSRQSFAPTTLSPEAGARVSQVVSTLRSDGIFAPPSLGGTLIYPGFDGGGEWGGAAADPQRGILYLNSQEMAWVLTLFEIESEQGQDARGRARLAYMKGCASCHGLDRKGRSYMGVIPSLEGLDERLSHSEAAQIIRDGKGVMPSFRELSDQQVIDLVQYLFDPAPAGGQLPTRPGKRSSAEIPTYGHTGYNRLRDSEEYPAVAPPWGNLTAIDLNRGNILWQVPLGEYEELTARGIPQTGTENYGGPVVTAAGLLFIAATQDNKFRAFDVETGETVWETRLPAAGYATPATYAVNGRQYIVIACGGGKVGSPSGDTYVAFSLP